MVLEIQKQSVVYILAIAVLTLLFFIGGPNYYSPRSFKHFWNLGHILYFALIPIILSQFPYFKKQKPGAQIAIVIIVTILLGILVELIQSTFSRSPDMGDIFRNLIGTGIAICFLLPVKKKLPTRAMIITRTILIILVGLQIYPIMVALIDEHRASRKFPILSDFQTARQLDRWEGDAAISIEENIGHAGNGAMRVNLDTQLYSGVALKYFPRNWQGYRNFEYRVYNPSKEQIKLTCRIHDRMHTLGPQLYEDRFNKTHSFSSGWHTLTIALDDVRLAPSNREMDLRQVYAVGLFATQLPHPRTIYIDDVKLY